MPHYFMSSVHCAADISLHFSIQLSPSYNLTTNKTALGRFQIPYSCIIKYYSQMKILCLNNLDTMKKRTISTPTVNQTQIPGPSTP